jgi:hypothetical protein
VNDLARAHILALEKSEILKLFTFKKISGALG